MRKKRMVRKENLLKKMIEDEKDYEKKLEQRKKRKSENREELRQDFIKQLEEFAETLDDEEKSTPAGVKSSDIEMKPVDGKKKLGVIRKIGKGKTKKIKANKSFLLLAKEK